MSDEIDKLIEDAVEGKIEVQFARVDGEPVMFYPDVKKACRAVAKAVRDSMIVPVGKELSQYGEIREKAARRELARGLLNLIDLHRPHISSTDTLDGVVHELREIAEEGA